MNKKKELHTTEEQCACEHEHEHAHDHEHEHAHEHAHGCACCGDGAIVEDKKQQKKQIIQIILAVVLLAAAVIAEKLLVSAEIIDDMSLWLLPMYLVPYFIAGYKVIEEAFEGLIHKELFNENFLMLIATVGALCIGEYPEAVAVMIFYCIGELFEQIAVARSRRSISSLAELKPESAHVLRGEKFKTVAPEQVKTGDLILVRVGEKIPLDGVVETGTSSLDTAALTGESFPREAAVGDTVYSGSINLNAPLKIRVTEEYKDSTVSKILELVEHSAEKKAKSEKFIRKFAKIYTPVVVIAALLLAVVPPLVNILLKTDLYLQGGAMPIWTDWIHRALTFLVISCPCALVISVPLGFFAGVGAASRQGILVKGTNYLEVLSQVKTVAFDKTGTLTKGKFSVTAVHSDVLNEAQMLETAALAEMCSVHPIAQALKSAYGKETDEARVSNIEEIAGKGIAATIDGKQVHIGNAAFMEDIGAGYKECHQKGTTIHLALEGDYMGHIVIADTLKADAKQTISNLHAMGVNTVMLSGDKESVAENVAQKLKIGKYFAELLPQQKAEKVEALKGELSKGENLAFVGDGINDAPVLALADVGIAMGALGSDAAIESADVVLMDDRPGGVVKAMRIARRTKRIVTQNIVFSIAVKLVILILGALGLANMWLAVFADVGVCVLAVLNAMRAYK
ncbi:MAG: cadmium-translocating P-type ATPase [Ruminococcaceae bacterium]|nr:cadmium-translocating P-type ATPase [Oscillospiraceae bacterium]